LVKRTFREWWSASRLQPTRFSNFFFLVKGGSGRCSGEHCSAFSVLTRYMASLCMCCCRLDLQPKGPGRVRVATTLLRTISLRQTSNALYSNTIGYAVLSPPDSNSMRMIDATWSFSSNNAWMHNSSHPMLVKSLVRARQLNSPWSWTCCMDPPLILTTVRGRTCEG
jgi:hypothetical protein